MDAQRSHGEQANIWGRSAGDGFADAARYLQSVPESEWDGPSGCSEWTIRYLAGHIVGEAVWFPNLVRGVTRGEEPYPGSIYPEMFEWEPGRTVERIAQAADEIPAAVDGATEEQLETRVDMGFDKIPLWRATLIGAMEGVLHDWDTKARRENHPEIPREWALNLAGGLIDMAPLIAHHSQISKAPGVYLLEIEDFGPITVVARGNDVTVERGAHTAPDVTLILTPDEYVRLLTGRLGEDHATIRVEGDRGRVAGLERIFSGIANGD
jgi:uncharacterized protein (TIGR03083 family)